MNCVPHSEIGCKVLKSNGEGILDFEQISVPVEQHSAGRICSFRGQVVKSGTKYAKR